MTVLLNLHKDRYGGSRYEAQLAESMSSVGEEVCVVSLIKHEDNLWLNFPRIIWLWLRFAFFYRGTLLLTLDTALFAGWAARRNTMIIHHLNYPGLKGLKAWFIRLNRAFFFGNKFLFSRVVVVSRYWQQKLNELGVKNTLLIYNSLDPEAYNVPKSALREFKEKHGLTEKPIVYLGSQLKNKGTDLAYGKLTGLNVHLVTSGRNELNLPVTDLKLSFEEYKLLLHVSDVVVQMSVFEEGWNRIAHESILCGTPVIGSGRGGMRELLEKSGQIVCEDVERLPNLVQKTIGKQVTPKQQAFVRTLDGGYLRKKAKEMVSGV